MVGSPLSQRPPAPFYFLSRPLVLYPLSFYVLLVWDSRDSLLRMVAVVDNGYGVSTNRTIRLRVFLRLCVCVFTK